MGARVAVVGGGPAGSLLALRLARGGLRPTLFHDPCAGEKPCGGGITARAFEEFPEVAGLQVPRVRVRRARLISPGGRETVVTGDHLFSIFSRARLDAALREAAREAGARVVLARVRDCRFDDPPRVLFDGTEESFDLVVGADGARSLVARRAGAALPRENLCPSVGLLVEGFDPGEGAWIRFFPDLRGYLWVFPRGEVASVGVVGRPGDDTAKGLRRRVEQFVRSRLPGARVVGSYGWMIPTPGEDGRLPARVSGPGWALVGDAAGVVDPITGEGIYWAFVSAGVLASTILEGAIPAYARRLAGAVEPDFAHASAWAARFFRATVLETVLAGARRSRRVRGLVADLMSGRQRYATLPDRIRSSPGGAILAFVFRTFLAI